MKQKKWCLTWPVVVLFCVAFVAGGCSKKKSSQEAKKDSGQVPLLQLVKVGMVRDEVTSLVGQPIHTWNVTGSTLPFLAGIDEVWIYFNPFPDSLPRRVYLYFDAMGRVTAIDRQGTGLPDAGNARLRSFVVDAADGDFFLRDLNVSDTIDEAAWNKDITEGRIAMAEGIVGIRAATNGYVPVSIEVSDVRPEPANRNAWALVLEARLSLPNGLLVLEESGGEEVGRISVYPGDYRVRVHVGGVDSKGSIGAGEAGSDYYQIILWPSE